MTALDILCPCSILLGSIPATLSWRLRLQKDDKLLNATKRSSVESKIQELAKKLGINKPIELIEKKGLLGPAQAQGVAFFSGRAGIAINPDTVDKTPEEELEFLIAHELAHIKANDAIWTGVVPSIIGVIMTSALSILFLSSAAYFSPIVMATLMVTYPAAVCLSVSFVAFSIFSKWREECADKLGLSVCSDAAQKAAPKFFDKIRTSQIEYRNRKEGPCLSRLLRRCLITGGGDVRFDIFHPSLETRIKYLQPVS
jgi:Zn-dependent protease with chaperone function